MLFARQRDLPFTELNLSIRNKSLGAASTLGSSIRQDGVSRPKIMRLDTAPRRSVAPRIVSGPGVGASTDVASATSAPVIAGPVPGALFARKRIEHAIELFGACMFIAFALALALFA